MAEMGWEIEVCGRCGGSGKFSWCQMHGDRCFGCGGSGKVFSKRALKARAWLKEQCMVLVSELKLGERVVVPGVGKFNVKSITPTGSIVKGSTNGVPHEWEMFEVKGEKLAVWTSLSSKIQKVPTAAQVAEAIAMQNSLKPTRKRASKKAA